MGCQFDSGHEYLLHTVKDFTLNNLDYIYLSFTTSSTYVFSLISIVNSSFNYLLNNNFFYVNTLEDWAITNFAVLFNSVLKDLTLKKIIFMQNLNSFINTDLIFYGHPEFIFILNTETTVNFLNFSAELRLAAENTFFKETFDLSFLKIVSVLLVIVWFIFIVIFLELNINIPEPLYSTIFLLVESEKEIAAFDDILIAIFFLFFIFGWYFGSSFIFSFLSEPEFLFLAYLFPLFASFLFGLPLNLLFDFGLSFLVFLRGSAASSSFILEMLFDYIGVLAFFIRLLVQLVRLVVMFFIYSVMHDAVILEMTDFTSDFIKTSFWEEFNSVLIGNTSASYYFLINLPQRLIYWVYEVIHTFFVVTVQFSAFFVIAFWLFLLFYTFFTFEKFENHFKNLRIIREQNLNKLN